jgi:hypothetical protein
MLLNIANTCHWFGYDLLRNIMEKAYFDNSSENFQNSTSFDIRKFQLHARDQEAKRKRLILVAEFLFKLAFLL